MQFAPPNPHGVDELLLLLFEKSGGGTNDEPPARIEIYDNSHVQGAHALGAMVVAGPEGFVKPVVLKCVLPQLAKDRAFVQLFLDQRLIGEYQGRTLVDGESIYTKWGIYGQPTRILIDDVRIAEGRTGGLDLVSPEEPLAQP